MEDYRRLYSSRRWRTLSRAVLARDRYVCATEGCQRPADTVDHVVSAWELFSTNRPHLFWDPSNLVSRCRQCNSRRGARERNARYRGVPRRRRLVATAEARAIAWAAEENAYWAMRERERLEAEHLERLTPKPRPVPRIY